MSENNAIENPQLDLAFDFLQYTNKNVFLTGKAGTGKTTFLHNLRKQSPKRMIVVAPTGVAAINAKGVTIHSFFQLPFGPILPLDGNDQGEDSKYRQNNHRFSREKINIIKSLDLLVIDEISMVRADLLDGIDEVLRRFKDKNKPFGGVQLLMIGDIAQLSPVIKEDEWELLKSWYDTAYFFSSRALKSTDYVSIELKHIYRQKDQDFVNLLNKVRENKVDDSVLEELNKRFDPNITQNTPEGYIILTTHNNQAKGINHRKLDQIDQKSYTYKAEINGTFPEYSFPTELELVLKEGAQVMFIRNDTSPDKQYYNGKIGRIENISHDSISVKCPEDQNSIQVIKSQWENVKYTANSETGEVEESIEGTFIQYPLKLAWAITIHKSQGLTFERAIIDAGTSFAHGQVYVALSRCKTLEGMVLSSKLSLNSIKSDRNINQFSNDVEANPPDNEILQKSKYEYVQTLLHELFDFTQTKYLANNCVRISHQSSESVQTGLEERFKQILAIINKELIDVSDKFKLQINQLFRLQPEVENNPKLQERIIKACAFFEDKIKNELLSSLQEIEIESDNKTVRKSLGEALEKLQINILIKLDCLKGCNRGFILKEFLETRAKASILNNEKPKLKSSTSLKASSKDTKSEFTKYPELYQMLKDWRTAKAFEYDQPAFFVLHQKVLLQIIEKLPISLNELKLIKGMGKQKINAFGQEIVQIVSQFCSDNSIDKADEIFDENHTNDVNLKSHLKDKYSDEEDSNINKNKNTRVVTLEMHKQGMSLNEIAKERKLTLTTIEGHIADIISKGELSVYEFMHPERISIIIEAIDRCGKASIKLVKEELGDDFSYGEIKMAYAHMKWNDIIS